MGQWPERKSEQQTEQVGESRRIIEKMNERPRERQLKKMNAKQSDTRAIERERHVHETRERQRRLSRVVWRGREKHRERQTEGNGVGLQSLSPGREQSSAGSHWSDTAEPQSRRLQRVMSCVDADSAAFYWLCKRGRRRSWRQDLGLQSMRRRRPPADGCSPIFFNFSQHGFPPPPLSVSLLLFPCATALCTGTRQTRRISWGRARGRWPPTLTSTPSSRLPLTMTYVFLQLLGRVAEQSAGEFARMHLICGQRGCYA